MHAPRRLSTLVGAAMLIATSTTPASLARAAATWSHLPIPHGVHFHSVVLDETRQRLIAFGGTQSSSNSNDVFVLSLTSPQQWQLVTPQTATRPTPRNRQGTIYDPVGDRLIVFGGNATSGQLGDVWALSLGSTPVWTPLAPGPGPSARYGLFAAFDPVRYRMIVFGGHDGTQRLNDTWALSLAPGGHWSNLAPAGTTPGPRWGHAGIYDPIRDQLVVFGGVNLATPYQDAWALSLGDTPTWTNLAPAGSLPSPRWTHTAAYDAARQRMIVFGGYNGTINFNDVWALALDGTVTWSQLTPAGVAPNARLGGAWIADPARDRMVGFGGNTPAGDLADVWTLSLAGTPQWSAGPVPGTEPALRYETPAVFDPIGQRMFIIGGFAYGAFMNDVWSLPLTGSPAWTPISPLGTPMPVRHSMTTTFDPVRNRIIVIGGVGSSSGTTFNDVWALTLAGTPSWSQLAPGGVTLPQIDSHTAVYDPVRDRIVVFGGSLKGVGFTNQVWALSLAGAPAWFELSPSGVLPQARWEHAAIYDPVRDRMVVHGGYGASGTLSDAWELRFSPSEQWNQLNAAPPLARDSHAGVYDPAGDRMVVFGGYNGATQTPNDAWALALGPGGGFTQITVNGTPPGGRGSPAAIFDPDRHRMLVFGGFSASNPVDAEIWSLDVTQPTLSAPPAATGSGIRLDAAFPDPAPGAVTIRFALPAAGDVSLRVFDVSGRLVRTLAEGRYAAGPHDLRWDRRTAAGASARPGLYFYELRSGGMQATRRLALTE